MPSSHLILCRPLLLLPPIPPSIRVFSNESALRMRWPKYWSFSFSINPPKNTQDWSPLEWTGWISLQSKGCWRVFSNTTVQKHQFFGTQPSSQFYLGAKWGLLPRRQHLRQFWGTAPKRQGGRTYLYVIWVKGEFMQSSTYLTKRFSASFEELMSPWRHLVFF